jgi:uncharacterized membrane protein YbaN (DUF454 family)
LSFIARLVLNIIGSLSLGLAILGIFLPLLPTTPFLLLASACYLRGSERLHRWLMNNRVLGEYIRNFQERRGIPLRAKVVTIALLWASVLFSIYKVEILALEFLLVAIAVGTSTLILRMKTLNRAGEN